MHVRLCVTVKRVCVGVCDEVQSGEKKRRRRTANI